MAVGNERSGATGRRRPVALMILRTGAGLLAHDRTGIDEDQLDEPVAHRAVARQSVIARHRFHEMQVGVRELESGSHSQVPAEGRGSGTPVAQEELSVPSEPPVVGMRLEQPDELGGEGQGLGLA